MAVFYLFFRVLLSRESYHRLNRIVLLATTALSFLLPLCVITIVRVQTLVGPISEPLLTPSEGNLGVARELAARATDWWAIGGLGIIVGALAVVVWSVASVVAIHRLMASSRRVQCESGLRLFVTEREVIPFSWFGNIVLSERDFGEDGPIIITHERAHQRFHHSVDILFVNLCCAVQWFNPAVWLLRRDLKDLHEYEADEAVLCSGVDAKQYQLLLIKKAVGNKSYSIANSLNHSTLKNRITMMLQKKSTRASRMRVLYVLPLVCLSLTAFAETETIVQFDDKVTQNISEKQTYNITLKGEEIFLNDQRVSLDGLAEALAQSGALAKSVVDITSEEGVRAELVTEVKEVLRKSGYLRITYDKFTARILPSAESDSDKVEVHEEVPFTLIPERNIMKITISADNFLRITFGGEEWTLEYDENKILYGVKTFVKNANNSENLPAKKSITITLPNGESRQAEESLGIVVVKSNGKANFDTYKKSINAIYRAYNDLRDELAREWFGRPLDELTVAELEVVFSVIPTQVAEVSAL